MKKIFIYILLTFFINNSLLSNETSCKKFDLKCKTKKFIKETKDYQNKGIDKSKEQLIKTKDKVLEGVKKK